MAADLADPADGHELVRRAPRPHRPLGHGEVRRHELIPARPDSALQLSIIELAPGASAPLGDDRSMHELVFVLDGEVVLATEPHTTTRTLAARSAFLHTGDDDATTVSAAAAPARLAVVSADARCDEHAALGPRVPVTTLDLRHADSATGRRSFQVMLGPENGCCRATLFVGAVPPGAAPWHFHLYDEIVLTLDGAGVYHQAHGDQPTETGSAVRIPPRTVHVNENVAAAEMLVLGAFTPAGSPAAAYLAADPRPSRPPGAP